MPGEVNEIIHHALRLKIMAALNGLSRGACSASAWRPLRVTATVTPFVRDIHVGTDGMLVVDQCQLVENPSHAQRMSVENCHAAAFRGR